METFGDGACCSPTSGRSCKTEISSNHKEMYKRTPKSWKDKFRRGCISRLRKNRNKLVEQLRGAVGDKESSPEAKGREFIDDLMREELKEIEKLDMTPNIFCDCCSFMDSSHSTDVVDSIFTVMDEIREELYKEERLILQKYNEMENFDDKCINAAIDSFDAKCVICPVCRKNQLLQNMQVLFCSCGLRIDTGYDGITLEHVQQQIDDTLQQHGMNCHLDPVFSVLRMDYLDLHNLILSCEYFLYLLLLATVEKDTDSSKSEINKAPLAYAVAYDFLSICNKARPLGAAERN